MRKKSPESQFAENLWHLVRKHIPAHRRQDIAHRFCEFFEEWECDSLVEAERLWKDAGRKLPSDEPFKVHKGECCACYQNKTTNRWTGYSCCYCDFEGTRPCIQSKK